MFKNILIETYDHNNNLINEHINLPTFVKYCYNIEYFNNIEYYTYWTVIPESFKIKRYK